MDEEPKSEKKKMLEDIAWLAFAGSCIGQGVVNNFITQTPSGLEQYLDNPVIDRIGLLIALGGAGFGAYSIYASDGCYKEEGLVTDGPHKMVRHPIYLGFRLGSLGVMILYPSLENLIACASVLVTTEITARMEDNRLLELYGDEFRKYQSDVPGWIPYESHFKAGINAAEKYIADWLGL